MPRLRRMDQAAALDGVERTYPKDRRIKVRVAQYGNARFNARLVELSLPELAKLKDGETLPAEVDRRLTRQAIADTLLLWWSGITDDRVPPRDEPPPEDADGWVFEDGQWWCLLEVSPDNALWLMSEEDFFPFQEWVIRVAMNEGNYARKVVRAAAKNSSASSPGSAGGDATSRPLSAVLPGVSELAPSTSGQPAPPAPSPPRSSRASETVTEGASTAPAPTSPSPPIGSTAG